MNWNLLVTGPAQKQLRRIPERDRGRVEAALLEMQDEPFSGDLVRLHAQPVPGDDGSVAIVFSSTWITSSATL
jgi:mRNA-degrading endonuclease RelE of RelBE toxin-antitoxin system